MVDGADFGNGRGMTSFAPPCSKPGSDMVILCSMAGNSMLLWLLG